MCTLRRLSAAIEDFLSDFARGKDVLDADCVGHTATLEAADTGFLASSILIIARKSASFPNVPTMHAEMST